MHDNSGPRSVYTYPVHKDIMKKIYQCMYMYINLYVLYTIFQVAQVSSNSPINACFCVSPRLSLNAKFKLNNHYRVIPH